MRDMKHKELNSWQKKILRYKRGLKYMLEYIFLEKMRGLDFSMRDVSLLKKINGKMHGYCKATESHVRKIFDTLDINEFDCLLDVGCGKGAVLREAVKYPFKKIDGIDIDSRLVDIANTNFEKLGLSDKVKCLVEDAINFEHYNDYNVFFFANPFGREILSDVIKKILVGRKQSCCIIYYHPEYAEEFEKYDHITKVATLYDRERDYETYIYRFNAVDNISHD